MGTKPHLGGGAGRGGARAATIAILTIIMVTAGSFTATSDSPSSHQPTYGNAQLQADTDAIQELGLTGVQAEVRAPGRTLRARAGVADLEHGTPVPWNGYFRIGSDTKTFVATVLLQLVGERKLALDDTVEKWLPRLVRGNGNDGRRITVRQLLRHNSGLHEYYDELPIASARTPEEFRRARFQVYSLKELVALAMRESPSWTPGSDERRWEYSNTNYILAAMIIAEATGNSWEQEVHERIIEPLGLRHTYAAGTGATVPRPRANFYQQFVPGDAWTDVSVVVDGYGDGGVISTTAELIQFQRALLGGRLLSRDLLAQMKNAVPAAEPGDNAPGKAYGLGLIKRRLPCGGWLWYHNGLTDGVANYDGVSTDGRRGAALVIFSVPADPGRAVRAHRAAQRAIDRAVCGTR